MAPVDPERPPPEDPTAPDARPLLLGWHRARVEAADEQSLDVRAVGCPACGVTAGRLCRMTEAGE